jgi:hypothetical protein
MLQSEKIKRRVKFKWVVDTTRGAQERTYEEAISGKPISETAGCDCNTLSSGAIEDDIGICDETFRRRRKNSWANSPLNSLKPRDTQRENVRLCDS